MNINQKRPSKESNILQICGNKDSMNLNSMILTNIQSSMYFKKDLYELKTYHEVIDEIFYRVKHLEPWEKGSRKTQGLTGMCGGVRGVGGGGIVSTAFCILYKLYTLKLTRKQVVGLIKHQDSPYIRGLGFMYIRYTQAPNELWDWYDEYLDDPEEIDVKAGGGYIMTIGNMLKQWLTRLEWFDTLFPRIPVPIQQDISTKLRERYAEHENIDIPNNINRLSDNGKASASSAHVKRTPPVEILEVIRSSKRTLSRSRSRSRTRSRDREKVIEKNGHNIESERHRHHHKHKHHKHHKHHKEHHKHKSKSKSRERESKRRHRREKSKSRSRSH